ncbi:hypothetical protein CDIK_3596 [Cucumispora dikerogammari]|nr:hypothetical protein CDIK_3596 [Cucumispora dikerogammari]
MSSIFSTTIFSNIYQLIQRFIENFLIFFIFFTMKDLKHNRKGGQSEKKENFKNIVFIFIILYTVLSLLDYFLSLKNDFKDKQSKILSIEKISRCVEHSKTAAMNA